MRSQSAQTKATLIAELREQMLPHIANGTIKAVIDSEYSLENVQKAHQRMDESLHIGKILLNIGSTSD